MELEVATRKEERVELIVVENCSDANNLGNNSFRGVIKSICSVVWNILKDWSISIGVKNQIGIIIISKRRIIIIVAERFFDFILFWRKS